jgi:hypothetical protein
VVEAADTRQPPAPELRASGACEGSITVDAGSVKKCVRAKEKPADDRARRLGGRPGQTRSVSDY